MDEPTTQILSDTQHQLTQILHQPSPPLPHPAAMHTAHNSIYSHLPETGRGLKATTTHLLSTVCPGLNNSSLSPTYWGFVTGGITPAARVAEHIVSTFDQNVCVHLPEESIATVVEDRALCMLLELLGFEAEQWKARVFNTGATAGNVQGLACGREYVLGERSRRRGLERREGEGVLSACLRAAVEKFQVLTTMPHSSLGKAANIVGIGSEALVDVSRSVEDLAVNMARLEELLADEKAASVVVVSCGEVNTGAFATHGQEMQDIRRMCDRYGAWLHVDGGKCCGLLFKALPVLSPTLARSGRDRH